MSSNKKFAVIIFIALASVLSLSLKAQSEKSVDEKLNELKGEVQKIIVETDKGNVTLEGSEAKKVFKRMKHGYSSPLKFFIGDDSASGYFYKTKPNKSFVWKEVSKDDANILIMNDELKDGKKVIINKTDGKLKVTEITEDENGEEIEKVYEDEKAEKFLEENEIEMFEFDPESGNSFFFKNKSGDKLGKSYRYNIIRDDGDDEERIIKWIDKDGTGAFVNKSVEIEKNGETKVTIITTDEKGEETKKVLEGEEAEKYLREHDNGEKVLFFSNGDKLKRKKHLENFFLDSDKETKVIIINPGDCDGEHEIKKEIIIKKKTKSDKEE